MAITRRVPPMKPEAPRLSPLRPEAAKPVLPGTEHVSARYAGLDGWPTQDAVDAMYEGQLAAVAAVRPALPALARAADEAADALADGGRLVYAGAGTSGRVAVQDGAELPPTFDWPVERLVFA